MPQGGRPLPPKLEAGQQQGRYTAEKEDWQRGSGGFSGAAKKDYLKWKRQQKAARAASSSEDEAGQQQHNHNQQPAHHGSPVADASPLQYRPLFAVPDEPFSMTTAPPTPADSTAVAAAAAPAAAAAAGSAADAAAADTQHSSPAVVYMPRLSPEEVGFTPAGFQLGMPTRPHWQGVVSTAEELHALEEDEFAAWQLALAAKAQQLAAPTPGPMTAQDAAAPAPAPGPSSTPAPAKGAPGSQPAQLQQGLAAGRGPVSCYEGRLAYWRQLWRTLEMADIICMIVDARNPLLHFSHALYRHITADHKLPLVLLLNKCDLLPAAAAAAWQQWLQQQLPGVTVIPVSACSEQAAETAKQVLSAVLQQRIQQDGASMQVQELLGLSVDKLMQESVRRNTHAKRHLEALQQQQQQQQQQQPPSGGSSGAAAAAPAAPSSSDDEQQWSTKPTKGRRAAARRKGRQPQQVQRSASGQALSAVSDAASASDTEGVHSMQHKQEQGQEQEQPVDQALASLTLEGRLPSTSANSCAAATSSAAATQADACCAGAAAAAAAAAAAGGDSRAKPGVSRPIVVGMLGEPNVGKSSTLNALLGAHRVAVSSHPGRTKHYQTHYMCDSLVLVDCPGIVFPRLNVSPAMQVLFGSSPIASCRQPYAVVRYLAEASWPRVQDVLKLHQQPSTQQEEQQEQQHPAGAGHSSTRGTAAVLDGATDSSGWSPYSLCEALAAKRHFTLSRSGRPDCYRAANWLLRAALAGQHGLGLAFLPPAQQ